MANSNLKRKPISNSVGNFDKDVAKAKAERVEAEEREPVMGTLQEEYDLIAGYRDSDGKLHRTFTIRQMNGEDEEALFRFNKMSNMKQMVMLCERLVESIGTIKKSDVSKKAWHDIIQNLYAADLDYIFLRIRETSIGEELEIKHKCGECGTPIITRMSVDELDIIPWDEEEGIRFELKHGVVDANGTVHTKGIIRYPRVCDREATVPIAAKNPARSTTLMLSRVVKFDDEEFECSEKVIQQMSTLDRRYLASLMDEHQFGVDLKVLVECPECGNTFDGIIGVGGNFI